MDYFVKNGDIQAAIDTAFNAGGGRVVLEAGVYPSSTIVLKSNIELHLCAGAKILGSSDPDDYMELPNTSFAAPLHPGTAMPCRMLIFAENVENIAITGNGEIDGQGSLFFDCSMIENNLFYKRPPVNRPRMIQIEHCKNVRFEGVLFNNCPRWTFWIIDSEDVFFDRIRILGDQKVPNHDGIHLDACRRVFISSCVIITGDDSVVIRAFPRKEEGIKVCENVVVDNCVLESLCQCIRIGCPSDGDVKNCTINNCILGGRRGISFSNPAHYVRNEVPNGIHVDKIMFSNLVINVTNEPIMINVDEGISLRRLGGITFSNIRSHGGSPCRLSGTSATRIENVCFSQFTANMMPEVNEFCENIIFDQVVVK